MKNRSGQQVKVGIFVTIGLLLSMWVIFLLGDISGLLERQYTLYARFNDISGLRLGAPIFLAGINVGKVEAIRFPQELEERKVIVTMSVRSEYKDRIRKDSSGKIVTQGLLGDKAIFVTVGSPDEPELENGEELSVKTAFSLDTISEQGTELIENINKLAKNINKVIADVKTEDSLVHALLYDPEGKKIVNDLVKMVNSATGIINEIKYGDGVLHSLIFDPTKKNMGDKFSNTIANFESMSKNMKEISSTIEQGEGSVGGLINDPTVYYDLMTLLGNANRNKILRTVIRATLATNEKDLTGGD